jgi:hypothetical protein
MRDETQCCTSKLISDGGVAGALFMFATGRKLGLLEERSPRPDNSHALPQLLEPLRIRAARESPDPPARDREGPPKPSDDKPDSKAEDCASRCATRYIGAQPGASKDEGQNWPVHQEKTERHGATSGEWRGRCVVTH